MSSIEIVQGKGNGLNSDHIHDGHLINTNNYRGELCTGHNFMLVDFDAHPEWAGAEGKDYMTRRPYKK